MFHLWVKMRQKRKCFQALLALVTVLALTAQSSAALAAGIQAQIMEIQTQQSVERLQANRAIYTQATEFEGIQKSAGNSYAMEVSLPGEEKTGYQPVVRMDIDLTDTQAVADVLSLDALPDVIKEEISAARDSAMESGAQEATVTLFAPSEFTIDYKDRNDPITPSEDLPRSDDKIYYTYQGSEMVSVKIYWDNKKSDPYVLAEGEQTKAFAAALTEIAVSGVLGNPVFEVVETGYSILQAFMDLVGVANMDNVMITSEDALQVTFHHNLIAQFTFTKVGNRWHHGLTTKQLKLLRIEYFQKYDVEVSPGHYVEKEDTITETYNRILTTPYFDDPWQTAKAFIGNPLVMMVQYKLHGRVFNF